MCQTRRSWANRLLKNAVPDHELLLFLGCLIMLWMIGAASASGYALTAVFLLVAAGRLVRKATDGFATTLPKRSIVAHYAVTLGSVLFFTLMAARACYIVAILIDAGDNDGTLLVSNSAH